MHAFMGTQMEKIGLIFRLGAKIFGLKAFSSLAMCYCRMGPIPATYWHSQLWRCKMIYRPACGASNRLHRERITVAVPMLYSPQASHVHSQPSALFSPD